MRYKMDLELLDYFLIKEFSWLKGPGILYHRPYPYALQLPTSSNFIEEAVTTALPIQLFYLDATWKLRDTIHALPMSQFSAELKRQSYLSR